jgi:hypothetical protein
MTMGIVINESLVMAVGAAHESVAGNREDGQKQLLRQNGRNTV